MLIRTVMSDPSLLYALMNYTSIEMEQYSKNSAGKPDEDWLIFSPCLAIFCGEPTDLDADNSSSCSCCRRGLIICSTPVIFQELLENPKRTIDDPFVLSYCITSSKPTDENSGFWVILIVRAKYSFLQQYFKSSGKPDERPTTSFSLLGIFLIPLVSTDPAD